MVRVKICGITNKKDALCAVDLGADALGFVFAESPRRVSVEQAERISRRIGPWVFLVGVFVDAPAKEVLRTVRACRLSAVQLHGDETSEYVKGLDACRVIKAFRVQERADLRKVKSYGADAILFDTKVGGKFGGSGQTFDWEILRSKTFKVPFIISGGLNPGNVEKALRMLSPYGVDVSSGIEDRPGVKNARLMREFIHKAKNAT